jgi:hypothetical protein
MAITYVNNGVGVYGAASLTPAIPTAQLTTDMMILIATGKPFDAGWSVATAGWTALGRGESGTTAAGIDLGSMAMQVWYKEATSDTETNPTVTEGSPVWNVVGAIVLVFAKEAGDTWVTPTVVYGADETSGTSISATMSADNSVAAGDFVVATAGMNTDALGPLTTALTASQTGVTFGTWFTNETSESTAGGDMAMESRRASITAGPSSAAAVLSGTGTASGGADRCELGYIRLRVSTAAAYPLFTVPDMAIYPGPS